MRLLLCGLVTLVATIANADPALYVGQFTFPGFAKTYVFSLPLTGAMPPPSCLSPTPQCFPVFYVIDATSIAFDSSGKMFLGATYENFMTMIPEHYLKMIAPPVGPSSSGIGGGDISRIASRVNQIALAPSGDLWVASGTQLLMYHPPFVSAAGTTFVPPAQTINPPGATLIVGVGFDAAANMYAADFDKIYVYAPPYNGSPVITVTQGGSSYRALAISNSQLFISNHGPTPAGAVDVYNLPLTASSNPAFRITNGISTPDGITLDAARNLYVANGGAGLSQNIAVYAPPFSATSAPQVVEPTCFATECAEINALAVGPSIYGTPPHFAVTATASATAGSAFNFTVTALDVFNHTFTGYAGTVHFTSSDGAATVPPNSTLTNGVGTFSATLKTAGNQTIIAVDTATPATTGTSGTIAVNPGAATHFTVTATPLASAGSAFNFTVTALDAFNNVATSYAGMVHFTSSDGAAILPADSTLTNGTGTFSATMKTPGNQTITASDTVTPAITGSPGAIAVSAPAAIPLASFSVLISLAMTLAVAGFYALRGNE